MLFSCLIFLWRVDHWTQGVLFSNGYIKMDSVRSQLKPKSTDKTLQRFSQEMFFVVLERCQRSLCPYYLMREVGKVSYTPTNHTQHQHKTK